MDLKYYDAQTAVLGSLLIDPRLAGEIFSEVSADDFSDAVKRNIFTAARDIFLERGALDPVTITERAGSAYAATIADVMRMTPTARNCGAYIKLLKDGAQLMRMQELGAALGEAKTAAEGRQILAKAQGLIGLDSRRRSRDYAEMLSDFFDRMNDPAPPDYLDFGIEQLNRKLHISRGRFVVLGADSSFGKTAFALQLAYHMAAKGKRVGFFSYETSLEDAADRIIANSASTMLSRIKAKKLSNHDIARGVAEGERSASISLRVAEAADNTVDELRAEALFRGYDVIFIDYVQLVPPSRAKSSRFETVTEVSMQLHTMAQKLGITVIALSQVTPPEPDSKGKRRELRKEDLRESRQLIQDAEAILMLDLVNPNDRKSDRVLILDKNKDGPLGKLRLRFDPEYMRFTYVDPKADKPPMENVTFEELPVRPGEELPF